MKTIWKLFLEIEISESDIRELSSQNTQSATWYGSILYTLRFVISFPMFAISFRLEKRVVSGITVTIMNNSNNLLLYLYYQNLNSSIYAYHFLSKRSTESNLVFQCAKSTNLKSDSHRSRSWLITDWFVNQAFHRISRVYKHLQIIVAVLQFSLKTT